MKKLRNTRAANIELGNVLHVEYLEELSQSHQSGTGLLMFLWTSGSVDLIDLEKRECVQVFKDNDVQGRPTSVTFFPQVHAPCALSRRTQAPSPVYGLTLHPNIGSTRILGAIAPYTGCCRHPVYGVTAPISIVDASREQSLWHQAARTNAPVPESIPALLTLTPGPWQKDFPVDSLRRSLSAASSHSSKSLVPARSFKLLRTGSLPKERKPHFAVVGTSGGMLKVWTPSTISPPAVTHKFKSITLDPNLAAGAIVGVARIEQVDFTGQKAMGLLTASAKGSICLFRAYTWEPLSLAQVLHMFALLCSSVRVCSRVSFFALHGGDETWWSARCHIFQLAQTWSTILK